MLSRRRGFGPGDFSNNDASFASAYEGSTTGNSLASLAERMRARTEQDRQEFAPLPRQQLNALSESL